VTVSDRRHRSLDLLEEMLTFGFYGVVRAFASRVFFFVVLFVVTSFLEPELQSLDHFPNSMSSSVPSLFEP